jgi:hypothetical protein
VSCKFFVPHVVSAPVPRIVFVLLVLLLVIYSACRKGAYVTNKILLVYHWVVVYPVARVRIITCKILYALSCRDTTYVNTGLYPYFFVDGVPRVRIRVPFLIKHILHIINTCTHNVYMLLPCSIPDFTLWFVAVRVCLGWCITIK